MISGARPSHSLKSENTANGLPLKERLELGSIAQVRLDNTKTRLVRGECRGLDDVGGDDAERGEPLQQQLGELLADKACTSVDASGRTHLRHR